MTDRHCAISCPDAAVLSSTGVRWSCAVSGLMPVRTVIHGASEIRRLWQNNIGGSSKHTIAQSICELKLPLWDVQLSRSGRNHASAMLSRHTLSSPTNLGTSLLCSYLYALSMLYLFSFFFFKFQFLFVITTPKGHYSEKYINVIVNCTTTIVFLLTEVSFCGTNSRIRPNRERAHLNLYIGLGLLFKRSWVSKSWLFYADDILLVSKSTNAIRRMLAVWRYFRGFWCKI